MNFVAPWIMWSRDFATLSESGRNVTLTLLAKIDEIQVKNFKVFEK